MSGEPTRRAIIGATIGAPIIVAASAGPLVRSSRSIHPALAEVLRLERLGVSMDRKGVPQSAWDRWEADHKAATARVVALPLTKENAEVRAKAFAALMEDDWGEIAAYFDQDTSTAGMLVRQTIISLAGVRQ